MCIFHALVIHCILPPLAHTFAALVMHWSISCFFILACHVYLMLCSILLCLMFWASFSHSSCTPRASFSLFIPSSLTLFSPWPLCLFVSKRRRVYSRVYTGEFFHFYMALVHFLRGEILFLVHICRERDVLYGRCIYQGGEDIVLTRKLCFVCHFFMTILVYDQISHMYYIMFTWSQFTCFIMLVLLLLALPWGSNMLCASVSGYKYICSKFITSPMIYDRGSDMIREVLYDLYPCWFCKILGLFSCNCRLLWFVPMPCCIVLVVLSCITSSNFTLAP